MSAVGLDCEWQPTYYGGKGPTEINPTGDNVDHPVATLQLAFRDQVFVIDMLSISGFVTKIDQVEEDSSTSTDIGATSDQSTQLRKGSRRILSSEERALCAAIGELFSHTKIAILGQSHSLRSLHSF